MILKAIHKIPFLRRRYFGRQGKAWVAEKTGRFLPFLTEDDKILDIGAGGCLVARGLIEHGFQVTALDITDLSYFPEIRPVLYDGEKMPFPDNAFDVALLLTVLHHTADPDQVLKEATRVARRIIVVEDIYRNPFQKYLTLATDTVVNWGFSEMHYSNRDDSGWRACFQEMKLDLKEARYDTVLAFFLQATYFLTKSET
jgi:ubiquinone/menaquinone biosynthesis C-methylase UbiE